jgi:hypothetical protein
LDIDLDKSFDSVATILINIGPEYKGGELILNINDKENPISLDRSKDIGFSLLFFA